MWTDLQADGAEGLPVESLAVTLAGGAIDVVEDHPWQAVPSEGAGVLARVDGGPAKHCSEHGVVTRRASGGASSTAG